MSICCNLKKVFLEAMHEIVVPHGVVAGEALSLIASDGHEVSLEVPDGCSEGSSLMYTEVTVPAGCAAGDSLTLIVAAPELQDVQVFDVAVPEDYGAGDLMVVLIDDPDETHDWDAEWAAFSAQHHPERVWLAQLRGNLESAVGSTSLDTAHVVVATLLVAYMLISCAPRPAHAPICRRRLRARAVLSPAPVLTARPVHPVLCALRAADTLHSSGGVVLVPDGGFGMRAHTMTHLNPIAQWQLERL